MCAFHLVSNRKNFRSLHSAPKKGKAKARHSARRGAADRFAALAGFAFEKGLRCFPTPCSVEGSRGVERIFASFTRHQKKGRQKPATQYARCRRSLRCARGLRLRKRFALLPDPVLRRKLARGRKNFRFLHSAPKKGKAKARHWAHRGAADRFAALAGFVGGEGMRQKSYLILCRLLARGRRNFQSLHSAPKKEGCFTAFFFWCR